MRLDLSDTSTEVHPGSEKELNGSFVNLNLSNVSASTFESGPSPQKFGIDIIPKKTASSDEGKTFVTEAHTGNESESSFFEVPDSPSGMPPLQAAPILRDVTNLSPTQYEPPEKAGKLDNLNEPFSTSHQLKYRRQQKQPVTIVKENAHCQGLPAFRARGAQSRPAPGRNFYCC